MPLVRRTRATLRRAELGFFGVVVYTRVHTPRRWGLPLRAGVLVLSTLSSRPLRTSCWIVGTASPCSLLPFSVSFLSSRGRAGCYVGARPPPPPALGRVALRPQDRAPAERLRGGPALREPTGPPSADRRQPWRAERPGEPQARSTRLPGPCCERQNGRSAGLPARRRTPPLVGRRPPSGLSGRNARGRTPRAARPHRCRRRSGRSR